LSIERQQKRLLTLKIVDKLLIAGLLLLSILVISFSQNQTFFIYGVTSLCLAFFLLLINRQLLQESQTVVNEYEANKKAEIYTYLLSYKSSQIKNFTPVKAQALQYCQDLIEDYRRIRNLSRTIYYVLQITTVVFSGITPILVLVDKIEARQTWLKWLPVICPAIASILASIVTSFPFQKNWVAANTVVELLEAEAEKFILGVTQPYRIYDSADEVQQQQKASQALEYFIQQVNNIHFQQVQQSGDTQAEKQESAPAKESESEPAA
jgi:ABC-type sugar transport system permease subunit